MVGMRPVVETRMRSMVEMRPMVTTKPVKEVDSRDGRIVLR